jgi:spore coat protein A
MSFKKLIKSVLVVSATMIVLCAWSVPGVFSAEKLEPDAVEKYAQPMPVLKAAGLRFDMTSGGKISVEMQETSQNLLGEDIDGNAFPNTTVWGYKFPKLPVTYPGATIVAQKDVPIEVKWENKLPRNKKGGHLLPVDFSLHMARPYKFLEKGDIPLVTHLHGGHTESASDGLPEQWYTQGFNKTGPTWVKKTFKYDNDQEGATLWYHDHALGITRLNVYAGLAGFYLLRDANENSLISGETPVLPRGDQEIEIVVQDRMFYDDGQLFFPAFPGDPRYDDFITGEGAVLPPGIFPGGGPTALAEFFGDIILVNGKAWPTLSVDQGKYRLRLLNGSDSRFYILQFRTDQDGNSLADAEPFLVIGNDDGLLNVPVAAYYEGIPNTLLIAPGERYDVVVDFSGRVAGDNIYLRNFGPDDPFGGGVPGTDFDIADVDSTGGIMRFDVTTETVSQNASVDDITVLRPIEDQLTTPDPNSADIARPLVLFEGTDEFGRLQPLLGTLAAGSLGWFEDTTENPALGATEVWAVYNATGDAHPIHLHLVSFRIIDRTDMGTEGDEFSGDWYVEEKPQPQHDESFGTGGILHLNTAPTFPGTDPVPYEAGMKDTAVMLPNQVTRVIATFDRPGRYVWHCHILSHEDNEMMRPFEVIE